MKVKENYMDFVKNIIDGYEVRESLIKLKAMDKESYCHRTDLKKKLIELLNDDDPKIRKNSALILGNMRRTAHILLEAYDNEKTEYVKDAYLKGICQQNDLSLVDDLKRIQQDLMKNHDMNAKHIHAQLKILNPYISKNNVHKKKIIKLQHKPVDVVLTTLPYYQFVLFEYVLGLKYKPVSQGVLVRTDSLYDILNIRPYRELLIPLQKATKMDIDIDAIMEGLKQCNLMDILDRLYDDRSVFYYRVVDNMREKNPQLIKKISEKLFEMYPGDLLNTNTNYDIEIVIKEIQKGKVNAYLKLTHLKSQRFAYRKEVIPNSMHPYVAATLVQLAKHYMIDDAKVLDPFVGSGTLLIERNIEKTAHFAMGIDIYGDGIEMAKHNSQLAQQNIHFVHKDALRFVNNDVFDEIITDMPTFAQMPNQEQLSDLYDRFFERLKRLVKHGGYIFIYTSEIALVRKNLRLQEGYLELVEHYDIPRGKNMFYFFIIQMK